MEKSGFETKDTLRCISKQKDCWFRVISHRRDIFIPIPEWWLTKWKRCEKGRFIRVLSTKITTRTKEMKMLQSEKRNGTREEAFTWQNEKGVCFLPATEFGKDVTITIENNNNRETLSCWGNSNEFLSINPFSFLHDAAFRSHFPWA